MASLKAILLDHGEQLLFAWTDAEAIEAIPDYCKLFIDAENATPPQQVGDEFNYLTNTVIRQNKQHSSQKVLTKTVAYFGV